MWRQPDMVSMVERAENEADEPKISRKIAAVTFPA
jgi:hypothetical protein